MFSYIRSIFSEKRSIKTALQRVADEINEKEMIPEASPRQLDEAKIKIGFDSLGNPIYNFMGVIIQRVRARKQDDTMKLLRYACYPFGLTTCGNVNISVALDSIENELKNELGTPLGEIQFMKESEVNGETSQFGGYVVQAYTIAKK